MTIKRFKLNTILLAIMFALLCFCLCGCASVNFVTYNDSDGKIYEYVYLTLDENALIDNNYNPEKVKLNIQTNAYTEASNLLQEYHNKLAEEYNLNHITNNEYSILFNGVKVIHEVWNNSNVYKIGLRFENSTIYKRYHEIMNGAKFTSNNKQVKKLFYTKTYYYGTANFGDYSIFNRIYNYYTNTIFSSISPQQTDLTYSYSVTSKRFHSDANKVYLDSNGNYIHVWNIDPREPSKPIYFYTISANRGVWLLTCIGLGLTFSIIITSVAIFKHVKNRKKNIQENKLENIK